MEECESDSLKSPHHKNRPKRGSQKITDRSKGMKKSPTPHEGFFTRLCKGFSDEWSERDRGEAENADKNADFNFSGAQSRKIDWKGGNEQLEHECKSNLRKKNEDKFTSYYLLSHFCFGSLAHA